MTIAWEDCEELVNEHCESPIEVAFFKAYRDVAEEWYVNLNIATPGNGSRPSMLKPFLEIPLMQPLTMLHHERTDFLWIQRSADKYRPDFIIARVGYQIRFEGDEPMEEVLVKTPQVVVECDGHDYHERTKEQAQRDKSRDRDLTAMGFRVLRFTGSELHRDARACAVEVHELLESLGRQIACGR